ncbi:MAG: DNA-binding protein [Acidimicrobiales bacterium]
MSRSRSAVLDEVPIPADWRESSTVSVQVAGAILGIARNTSYAAAASGDLPTIRLAGRILVPVALLRRMLGEDAA